MSSVLLGEPPVRSASQAVPPTPPASPPGAPAAGAAGQRNNTLTVIAGVGVLLLAMGVGVLIGRSSVSKQGAAPGPVITIGSTTSAGTATTGSTEASFIGDWPTGRTGYTVQLQTLPQSGTTFGAVESAKSSASAKGAKAVGALKSEEFSSLTPGSYVIYSGDYGKRAEAEKALPGLRKSFSGAKVVKVSNGGSSASSSAEPPISSPGGVGESENHPAPPSVLKSLKSSGGKGPGGNSYEEKSKNLPDVVED
jgi:hypothetical protein